MRVKLAILVMIFAPALVQAAVPIPREKPVLMASLYAPPIPRAKPQRREATPSARQWPGSYGGWPKSAVLEARRICEALLGGRDIIWRPDEPIGDPGGCGTASPIAVSEVAGIRISPAATVNCPFAAALDDWLGESVQPAARKAGKGPVTEIRNASSYACRRRNNGSRGKLSEHARANALDIASFRFGAKAEIAVAGRGGLFQMIGLGGTNSFVKAVRKDSCAYFNTVLGPGTDPYHKDHLHLDLMHLRPGRGKMCR